jgi:DNA-binding transcriptional LysR family regulator
VYLVLKSREKVASLKHSVSNAATPTYVRDLQAFLAVVESGSITGAAKQLGETKGAISRRLTRLEREIGTALLRRSTRMVQPTQHGLAYRGIARRVIETLTDASQQLQRTEQPSGRLRVASSHGFGAYIIAPLVAPFAMRYPNVELDIILTDETPNFVGSQLDVAIYPARRLPNSALIARRMIDWETILVAAPSYLRDRSAPKIPEDLTAHRIIMGFGAGAPHLMARIITLIREPGSRGRRIAVPNAVVATTTIFPREAALAGAGIGLVPDFMVARDLADGRLVQIFPDYRLSMRKGAMFMLYPATSFPSAALVAFRDFLAEAMIGSRRKLGRPSTQHRSV